MAKFIELPFAGPFNAETQKQERLFMTVNIDRIVSITSVANFCTTVNIHGAKSITAYRKYDTLSAQLMNKEDARQSFPDEELAGVYEAGYEKAKEEISRMMNPVSKDKLEKEIAKKMVKRATEFVNTHPLVGCWQKEFKKALLAEDTDSDSITLDEE